MSTCSERERRTPNKNFCEVMNCRNCVFTFNHAILSFNNLHKKDFENLFGKAQIACNQYFFLFPQCYLPYQRQKSSYTSKLKLLLANAFNLHGQVQKVKVKRYKINLNVVYLFTSCQSFKIIKIESIVSLQLKYV